MESIYSRFCVDAEPHPWFQGQSELEGGLVEAAQLAAQCYSPGQELATLLDVFSRGVPVSRQGRRSLGRAVETLVTALVAKNQLEDTTVLKRVWTLSCSGLLTVSSDLLGKVLVFCQDCFTLEVENIIIELLSDEENSIDLQSFVLIKAIACEAPLFIKSCQIFSRYFLELDFDISVVNIYQKFVSAILEVSREPVGLYPLKFRTLVRIWLAHREVAICGTDQQVSYLKNSLKEAVNNVSFCTDARLIMLQFVDIEQL